MSEVPCAKSLSPAGVSRSCTLYAPPPPLRPKRACPSRRGPIHGARPVHRIITMVLEVGVVRMVLDLV